MLVRLNYVLPLGACISISNINWKNIRIHKFCCLTIKTWSLLIILLSLLVGTFFTQICHNFLILIAKFYSFLLKNNPDTVQVSGKLHLTAVQEWPWRLPLTDCGSMLSLNSQSKHYPFAQSYLQVQLNLKMWWTNIEWTQALDPCYKYLLVISSFSPIWNYFMAHKGTIWIL